MNMEIQSAIDLYERHPISCEIILTKLNAARGHLDDLTPDELFPHDQDHYGGLAANDALAERAGMGKGTRVVDFCAGLGGPSRYFAHRYGAYVTGIELTPARVKGAEETVVSAYKTLSVSSRVMSCRFHCLRAVWML
jgi:SAM-dependent methyltransferase